MPLPSMNALHRTASYGFSSIGLPDATLDELVSLAGEFDLDFVELRALGGTVDLPEYFSAYPPPLDPASLRPPVRLVATNLHLIEATNETVAEFTRFVDVAVMLRAPYVRVFGGKAPWGEIPSPENLEQAVRSVAVCRAVIAEKSAPCEILLETHSAFSSSVLCTRLNALLDEPLCILWDCHHTWRSAGETPAETWARFGPLVRHIHFSDSRLKPVPGTGYDCILPGAGELPVDGLRRLLADMDYAYGVSLEWEKLWHPKLPDVRLALQAFDHLLAGRRAAAG